MENNVEHELVKAAIHKIDSCTEEEIKSDMKLLVVSLVQFVAEQDARILEKNTPSEDIGKLSFKMVANVALEAMSAGVVPGGKKKLEKKFENIIKLHPLLIKYSNG